MTDRKIYTVEMPEGNETSVLVEVYQDPNAPPTPAAINPGAAAQSFKDQLGPIVAVSKTILQALRKAEPTKVEIEYGFELGGSAGIPMITTGEAKANFKVTLTWEPEKK